MDGGKINPALKKKIQKLIVNDITDQDLIASLKNLSTFYGENTKESRWNLRDNLENKVLSVNKQFITSFEQISIELEKISCDIETMKSSCNGMEKRLSETKLISESVLIRAKDLFWQENINMAKLAISESFVNKFQLTPEEQKHLSLDVIDSTFYEIVNKLYRMLNDCKAIMQIDDQTLGTELKESIDNQLQNAFKKLYKWVRIECQKLDEKTSEFSDLLVDAFELLQDRQVFLKFCLEEYAEVRNKIVGLCFYQALTRGGEHGIPRPIDMYAHDPKRYVIDMAAWIHQSLANEHELICSLLRKIRKQTDEEIAIYKDHVSKVINHALLGTCAPFKSRCEHILTSEQQPVLLYQLYSCFGFYESQFDILINKESHVSKMFLEFKETSLKMYYSSVEKIMENLESNLSDVSIDLTPPHDFRQVMHMVDGILSIYDKGLIDLVGDGNNVISLISPFVKPLLKCIDLCSDSIKGRNKNETLDLSQQSTFKINCYKLITKVLSRYRHVSELLETINTLIENDEKNCIQDKEFAV